MQTYQNSYFFKTLTSFFFFLKKKSNDFFLPGGLSLQLEPSPQFYRNGPNL